MILGLISLSLGIIGIFVPLLPTTPFLLLAAFLFARSSKKFHTLLMNNKYLGPYIKNYLEHKAIPLKTKIYSLIFLWTTILYSVFFIVNITHVKGLLFIIAIGVTIHILKFKTLK